MRFLIGIMYSGEAEYELCKESIRTQTHKDWDWFFIEHKPAKEAHELLYRGFETRSSDFDAFVKIDADMVLASEDFLKNVSKVFESSNYNHLEILVEDFYVGKLIPALHVYLSSIRFDIDEDETATLDHVHYHTQKLAITDPKNELVPAAFHCPNPTPFQAFHYGAHRGIKYNEKKELKYLKNILGCFANYLKNPREKRIIYAYYGGYIALKNRLMADHINYENAKLEHLFKGIEGKHFLWVTSGIWFLQCWIWIYWRKILKK